MSLWESLVGIRKTRFAWLRRPPILQYFCYPRALNMLSHPSRRRYGTVIAVIGLIVIVFMVFKLGKMNGSTGRRLQSTTGVRSSDLSPTPLQSDVKH